MHRLLDYSQSRACNVAREERPHRGDACGVPNGYGVSRDGGYVLFMVSECQLPVIHQQRGAAAVACGVAAPLAIYNTLSDIPFSPLKITKLDLVTTSVSASAYTGMISGVR
jgi:hypothetical protein